MQFQFLAVSGRAAGDASIRDQPPVKSRASPASPWLTPKRNPVSRALSLSLSISHSLLLSPAVCPSLLPILVPSSRSDPRQPPPTSRRPRFPSNIEPLSLSFLSLTSPSLAVSTVLMRQMRSPRATLVSGRALEGFGRCISDKLCYSKLSCKDIRIRDEFEIL